MSTSEALIVIGIALGGGLLTAAIARAPAFSRRGTSRREAGGSGVGAGDGKPRRPARPTSATQVRFAAFSADGKNVLTGSPNGAVTIRDTSDGRIIRQFHDSDVLQGGALSPDGALIALAVEAGGRRSEVQIRDADTGTVLHRLEPEWPFGSVKTVRFSPDGSLLLAITSGGSNHAAHLWNPKTGVKVSTTAADHVAGHVYWLNSAEPSPDWSFLVTAGEDTCARIWSARGGGLVRQLGTGPGGTKYTDPDFDEPVKFAEFSSDGTRVITSSHNALSGTDCVRIWDAASGLQLAEWTGVALGRFSPDAVHVLAVGSDGTMTIRAAQSGAEVVRLESDARPPTHAGPRSSIALPGAVILNPLFLASFSPDGRHVLAWSSRGRAALWDVPSGRWLNGLSDGDEFVLQALFSPGGGSVITVTDAGSACLWDVVSGRRRNCFGN